MIGRAKRSDIRINFPSVSRSHAILSRDEAGTWRVNPLNHSSGVLLNGQRTLTTADLHPGDSIAVGGVELFFFPSDKPQPSGQPRRRPGPVGGLWLLTFIQLLLWAQFAPNFGAGNIYPISAGFFGLCGLGWVLYAVSRKLHRRQFDLEILALLLTTVGFAITAAWDPGALYKQLAAVTLGMGIYGTLVWLLGRLHLAVKLRWPVAAAAAALLAFNVVMGERIFGAKNWISVGPISFQPSELVKLAFILAGAATLDRLFAKRNLIFTVLFSAYCVGCLALMSDFGTALVFFVAFLCIAFLRTGDLASIVMMTAAAGFAGGLVLLVTKPFAVGDYVDTPCGAGTVKDLTLTYTYLDTPDGLRIAAPNSSISAGKITNYTALGTRRIEHAVSASYDAPVQTVRQALLDAVARTPGLLDKPAPEVYVNAYGESGIEYIVRAWARNADYWPAYYALLEGIKTAFDQRSVEMPYNHLNVHIVDPVRVERETKA